jgi:hypothetical protein
MTEQEMNDFLQSIGGLENGMYSNREPIMNAGFFECDEGWYQLLKDLIVDLIELGWNKQICQVKEKFGGLRFYANETSTEMDKRIRAAEDLSYQTCEVIGKPGQLRTDLGWIETLCEEEYIKRLEKRKQ